MRAISYTESLVYPRKQVFCPVTDWVLSCHRPCSHGSEKEVQPDGSGGGQPVLTGRLGPGQPHPTLQRRREETGAVRNETCDSLAHSFFHLLNKHWMLSHTRHCSRPRGLPWEQDGQSPCPRGALAICRVDKKKQSG